jgi:LmbE family N-acetylglucosaminyl deacetylase
MAHRALRWLKRVTAAAAEQGWWSGFRLAGALRKRATKPEQRVKPWSTPGGQRVLVVAPHPDDEVCGCGGTLLRHLAAGDAVTILYVTDGRGSRAWGLTAEAMAARRQQEAAACAAVLGVNDWLWLGLPEWDWAVEELAPRLLALLEQVKPDLIYAPSRVDFHPEHWKTAHALALALGQWPSRPLLRAMALQVPLGSSLTNVVSSTQAVQAQQDAAIAAHASQVHSTARTQRMRRYTAAAFGLPGEAEAFWEMSAARYQRLHADSPTTWPTAFRSLRYLPWSDGLAYVRGWRLRQTLSQESDLRRA